MTHVFNIAGRRIGPDSPPFIIAEMSGNHNQSLDRALALVDAAADAGAHAVKLQTYTADTITMPGAHLIEDGNSLWNGMELHALYKMAYTPWEWHAPLFERAKQRGMLAFSSPFDETAVDFLESLDVPAYKIASFENEHYPLMRKVVETGKPFIMSTGVIGQEELDASVAYLRSLGAKDFVLLKCTSTYPASPETTNLRTIPDMAARYGCQVGLSDHTMGIGAAVASVALGATVIEKHFTLRRADGGVDSAFSLEPEEIAALVQESERAWRALGSVNYVLSDKEKKQTVFKRSIYANRDLEAGHTIVAGDIRVVRPAKGLHPREFDRTHGRLLARDIKKGSPLTESDLQP
ncbi:pseudaminic acid synthase [Hydrogenophaga sp. BPS33]|uniref:pseudaminic acid synthase n=1 Tax=Hydrogenophaga sp. BPS33 TaxID=2651974 RepID=UPI00131F4962|nr:pseudaminic acid synthase [Hydrogenophaga sp. BPS33]QHE83764.1 pseudaminic acid synthase [Hydrogenophaga sp. BPS33]